MAAPLAGMWPGRKLITPVVVSTMNPTPYSQLISRRGNTHAFGDGLRNRPAVRRIKRTIDLAELERPVTPSPVPMTWSVGAIA